jgi:hypothetical protein
MPVPAVKGKACRIHGGKYSGKTGWYDTANKSTKKFVYVIVEDYDDEGKEKETRVAKENVAVFVEPQSYAEAALMQHPDILREIHSLCRKLAQCELDNFSQDILVGVFKAKLSLAVQKNTGRSARYRYVSYYPSPEEQCSEGL